MSVTNVQPPDKSIFEDAALETGIAAPFVEKDWYVTQVISALSAIETDGYEIIFSGGTALSKAHGLLQRFSEDIDFRVLTKNTGRKALSAYKNTVIEKLRESGFDIEDQQIKARDGNRYFSIDLDYKTQFKRPDALRPHVQIELTARDIQLPAVYLPVYSFVNRLAGHDPEVASIGCIDPVESAADKLSALAWRIPDRIRGGEYDDPAIVRHIHDLAVLKDAAMNNDDFAGLVLSSINHDDRPALTFFVRSGLRLLRSCFRISRRIRPLTSQSLFAPELVTTSWKQENASSDPAFTFQTAVWVVDRALTVTL